MSPPTWRSRVPDEVRCGAADAAALVDGGRSPAGGGFPTTPSAHVGSAYTLPRFRVIEAVDRQAFLTLPPLHGANTPPQIRGDFLPRIEPRLRPARRSGRVVMLGVEDSAAVRHYAPLPLRRLVALEPRAPAWTLPVRAHVDSLRAGRPKEVSMTMHSKIVIFVSAR